nr:MAG TPA: hypothetical protein [Caudoviricetes sp.]
MTNLRKNYVNRYSFFKVHAVAVRRLVSAVPLGTTTLYHGEKESQTNRYLLIGVHKTSKMFTFCHIFIR